MQAVVLFIPRILPNVTKKQIVDRFAELHIGRITHIQSKYRVNEKKNEYWFAFITITIWKTEAGCRFWNEVVVCKDTIRIEYFETKVTKYLYWEIQLCQRNNGNLRNVTRMTIFEETKEDISIEGKIEDQTEGIEETKEIVLEEGEIDESNLSKSNLSTRDHIEIYQDYLELERCIFGSNYLCKLY
jgi:hypothetical protein